MNRISVVTIAIPGDNYTYLLVCENLVVVIDATDARPVLQYLETKNLILQSILSTHHHSDHTAGNLALKRATGCSVISTDKKVKGVDRVVSDNEQIEFCGEQISVLHLPGHTRMQAAYYIESYPMIFTGDTLFGAGCGRLFECGPEEMYHSLMRLAELPEDTLVYFGHEYTKENLEFASQIEPENPETIRRLLVEREKLAANSYTTPSTIGLEKGTNPFLRCKEISVRRTLNMVDRSPVAVFAELRKRKDRF